MPVIPGNPSAPLPQSLSPQFPPWELMMRMWGNVERQKPWLTSPQGLLNTTPYAFPVIPGAERGLLQPVADIYKFPGRGVGPKATGEITEPYGGGAGRGGLLGSKWRDPRFVSQELGVPEGMLKLPSASVTNIAPPGGRQFDFGKYNAKVSDPRMLKPEGRIPSAKASEEIVRGAYFGKYPNQPPSSFESAAMQQQHMAKVEAAIKKLPKELVAKIDRFSAKTNASPYHRGNALIDAAEMKAARKAWESYSDKSFPEIMPPGLQYPQGKPPGPTKAQMARPVKQTPEISAKLAKARAERNDATILRTMFNMDLGMWKKMPHFDRLLWLRDAEWKSWPVEKQRMFMEKFMPKGIGGE